MVKRKWLMAVAAALAVAAIGGGAVLAQSSGEDGTGITFLDRVAGKLGIDTGTLEQAITDARTEEIDEAVANGDLTQEQSDEIEARLSAHLEEMIDSGFPRPFGGWRPFHGFPLEPGMEIPEGSETPEQDGAPESSGTSGGAFRS